MAKSKKDEAIVLLNDGHVEGKDGHCNSWPNPALYLPLVSNPESCL